MGIISQRDSDRKRQRAMYFQLFLLIAPTFGMPSKSAGGGGEVVNELQSFIDFSKETGDLLDNSQWIKEVFVSLERTESSVLGLEVELKTMPHSNETGLGLEGNFFPCIQQGKTLSERNRTEAQRVCLQDCRRSKRPENPFCSC